MMTMTFSGFLLGIGVALGVSLLCTFTFNKKGYAFLSYLTLGIGISVYAGLLDMYLLTISIIFLILAIFLKRSQGNVKTDFLVGFPLSVYGVLTMFQYFSGGSFITTSFSNQDLITDESFLFGIDPATGLLSAIVVIATVTILAGIKFLGTGLSETSVSSLRTGIGYTGIWLALTVLAEPLTSDIPVFSIGMWITFTIIFAIGVFKKMNNEGY